MATKEPASMNNTLHDSRVEMAVINYRIMAKSVMESATREIKARGKVVSWQDLERLPKALPKMDAYVNHGGLVFTDYKIKIVVHVNYRLKLDSGKTIVSNHVSSSNVIDANEFLNMDYKKIK